MYLQMLSINFMMLFKEAHTNQHWEWVELKIHYVKNFEKKKNAVNCSVQSVNVALTHRLW